jgi:hypothetical protein
MKLPVDTSAIAFLCALEPQPLLAFDTKQPRADENGEPLYVVQAQLGHATASITLDTYGHLFPSEMEALADRLEQARTAALVNRERTQRGPVVLKLNETAGR